MGLTPNLLNEDFNDITSWVDADTDTAVSEIAAGQLRLDTNLGAAGDAYAGRYKIIATPPNQFTIEIKTYFDALGVDGGGVKDDCYLVYNNATWRFGARFGSNGLFINKTGGANTEVGADIVLCNAGAAWQTWRFQVDKSSGESLATVEVFLNDVSQGTVDCDYELGSTDGRILIFQYGQATDNIVSHIDYIRIASGLGAINDTAQPVVNIF